MAKSSRKKPQIREKIAELLAAAIAHYQAGRLPDAESACREILKLTPLHGEALHLYGVLASQSGNFSEAIESLQQALLIKPKDAGILSDLGTALRRQRRLAEAIDCLEHALRIKPGLPGALYNLGLVFQDQGNHDRAIAQFAEVLRLRPNYPVLLFNLAIRLQEQGKLDDAIDRYTDALRLRPAFLEARYHVAVLLARRNRIQDAHDHLTLYLAGDPDDKMGARMVLARLGLGPLPDRASHAHVNRMYEQRAGSYDQWDAYYGHEMVARTLTTLLQDSDKCDILDAGCGTGLCGLLIREAARQLDGIDLSSAMLDKAKQKGIYTTLYQNDFVAFMVSHPASYDVVISAAALIHFGVLTPVFEAAATTLRDEGLFVFTLFLNEDERAGHEVMVAPLGGYCEGGCYLHGRDYVRRVAHDTGFTVVSIETDLHERSKGEEKPGLVVALRRTPRTVIQSDLAQT